MANYSSKAVLVDYDEDIFCPIGDEASILAEHGIEWKAGRDRTPEAVLQAARDADVVLVESVRPLLTREVIEKLERCRCIVRMGIGYDSVDVAAATERGIIVCNVPGFCTEDVAEHALALLLDGIHRVSQHDRIVRSGRWDRSGAPPARRIKGCTLGFIAFGSIPRSIAERVKGFGMTLLAYDAYVDETTIARYGAQKVGLEDILRRSDFISVHAPLSQETYHLLGHGQFDLMKRGVYLLNTSRGPVIDEEALVEALSSGKIAWAGLDVMEKEPLPITSPLRRFENVTLTPHVASNSVESVATLYRRACQVTIDVCQGRWPAGVVNPEVEGRTRYPARKEPAPAPEAQPLFLGLEHVGLYTDRAEGAQAVVDWYSDLFGFHANEGNSSFFVNGAGNGRLEVLKAPSTEHCHVAIQVSDFDRAVEALRARGIEFEEPKCKPTVKGIFLKQRDPAGNLVHLFWQAPNA